MILNDLVVLDRTTSETNNELSSFDGFGGAFSINPADIFLDTFKSKETVRVNTVILNMISKSMSGTQKHYNTFQWGEIRYYHIQMFIKKLREKNLSTSRINSYLCVFKGVSRQCRKLKLMPMEDYLSIMEVKSEKATRKPKLRWIKTPERELIVEHLYKENKVSSIRNLAIFSLLAGCGLRRAELCDMTTHGKNSININENKFKIEGKGSKERMITMPKWVQENVVEWLDIRSGESESDKVFLQVTKDDNILAKGLAGRAIANILKSLYMKMGIEKIKPHDLRASFCTNMLAKGVAMTLVSKAMGHEDINTTRLYDRRGELELTEAWLDM
jgi:integrase/recombinase XerD